MILKKNIWLVFNILFGLGFTYLCLSNYSYWQSIQQENNAELSSFNNIFSSSVASSFSQQEAMLELLGQQLFRDDFYKNSEQAIQFLDDILAQNKSFVGFGLANVQGQVILGSSNINLAKMPNLLKMTKTKDTFLAALVSKRISIGRTYYLKALSSNVIPLRKSIRNKNGDVLGVMTMGIKPAEILLGLDQLTNNKGNTAYASLLVQDKTFYRLYMASSNKADGFTHSIGEKITQRLFDMHKKALKEQVGLLIEDLKTLGYSVEYYAENAQGLVNQFSVIYVPKFKLWSLVSKPRYLLINELRTSIVTSGIIFSIVFLVLFLLFRSLSISVQKNRKELLAQANHDFLTGLHNRLHLKFAEKQWVFDAKNNFNVLFIDLDNFKNINDNYGHNIGDLILKKVAGRLNGLFDADDLVCRQGGDEFIILTKYPAQDIAIKAQMVVNSLVQPYQVDQYEFVIGVSMGISQFPKDGSNFETLFSAADSAMYSAKNKSIDYEVFTSLLSEKMSRDAKLEQALHTALNKNEIYMMYQPQINLKGQLFGVEALVRWECAELGLIPPDQFIPVAENSAQIQEIGYFIMRQSIADISKLRKALNQDDIQLSINISVRQFLEIGFLDKIKCILDEFDYPTKKLTLEITESIFIDDLDYILPLFNKIRALDIHLSLDDFGTGFSSLSILKRLPIDELKIDKSFIDLIVDSEADRTMVVNILNIAKSLNLKVVAEGIEDADQAEILEQHRCDVQQGYFYSKPLAYNTLLIYCQNYGLCE